MSLAAFWSSTEERAVLFLLSQPNDPPHYDVRAMRSALMHVGEGIGAVLSLLRLGWQTRFRVRGRYWQWRHETAFGAGEPPAPEKRKAMFDYARWVWRMGRYG